MKIMFPVFQGASLGLSQNSSKFQNLHREEARNFFKSRGSLEFLQVPEPIRRESSDFFQVPGHLYREKAIYTTTRTSLRSTESQIQYKKWCSKFFQAHSLFWGISWVKLRIFISPRIYQAGEFGIFCSPRACMGWSSEFSQVPEFIWGESSEFFQVPESI